MAIDDYFSRRDFLKKLGIGLGAGALVLAEPAIVNGLEYLSGRAGAGQAIAENSKFTCENKICKLDGYWTVDDFKRYIESFKGLTFVHFRHKKFGNNEAGERFWKALIDTYGKKVDRFVRINLHEAPRIKGKSLYNYVELKKLPSFDFVVNGEKELRINGCPKIDEDVYFLIKRDVEPEISKYI